MAMSPVVPGSMAVGFAGPGAILLSSAGFQGHGWLDPSLRWQDRQKQRIALLDLDARLMRDVGLSRHLAERTDRRHD